LKAFDVQSKKIFLSDCEGPLSTNDNAFEAAAHFIRNGNKLFSLVSKYDDVLADILKKPGYKAGNTLKLILPFFKAYNVRDNDLIDFSRETVRLVPCAKETIAFIQNFMHAFIINTGYEHYTFALCDSLALSREHGFGTKVYLDHYDIDEVEKIVLRKLGQEIATLPMIVIPQNAKSIRDFSKNDQQTIQRLDEIFWEIIPRMKSIKIVDDAEPRGGWKKAETLKDIVGQLGGTFVDTMFMGDSITDAEGLALVRSNGGLSISFNGNEYAVRKAEIAVISESTSITCILAEAFYRCGKDYVLDLVRNWSPSTLESYIAESSLDSRIAKLCFEVFPQVELVTSNNLETLIEKSCKVRKKVRGKAIGVLG